MNKIGKIDNIFKKNQPKIAKKLLLCVFSQFVQLRSYDEDFCLDTNFLNFTPCTFENAAQHLSLQSETFHGANKGLTTDTARGLVAGWPHAPYRSKPWTSKGFSRRKDGELIVNIDIEDPQIAEDIQF